MSALARNNEARPPMWSREARAPMPAPSIYEMDNVKKGILCQLFSGTNRSTAQERFRCGQRCSALCTIRGEGGDDAGCA